MYDKNITLTRFRELIDSSGTTREVIAKSKIINCDTSTITKHYNGDRSISSEYIVKYAEYFNVSTDYLLGLPCKITESEMEQHIYNYTQLPADVVDYLHNATETDIDNITKLIRCYSNFTND